MDLTSLAGEFGLHYYNARWYDSYLNHFTQPDSIVPDPYNPQDWNRYSYARNNPVRYSDPTGHYIVEDQGSKRGCHDPGYCSISAEMNIKIGRNYSKAEAAILRDMLRKGEDVTYNTVDYIVANDVRIYVEGYGENTGAKWTTDGNIIINSHGADFTTLEGVTASKYYEPVVGLIAHESKHLEQGPITALSVYGEFEGWKTQLEVEREMFQRVPAYGTTRDIVLNVPLTHDPDTLGWIWRAMVAEQGFDYLVWLLPLNPLNSGEGGDCGGVWCPALLAPYP